MTISSLVPGAYYENSLATSKQAQHDSVPDLPWVQLAPQSSYFITADGKPWIPVGHNDAITWPALSGLFRRKNRVAVEKYVAYLAAHGVNCLRLMLEYCQTENRYLERPAGKFQPHMVRLWDDLLEICLAHGVRVMLTPFDTFWMRKRWRQHPYNRQNGGPCASKGKWLCCPETLQVIKDRLGFATERWGRSGVIFAWDIWNEPDPVHAGNSVKNIAAFVTEISLHLRKLEIQLYGRTHLQTVGGYWPHIVKHPDMADVIFRHPCLDFATVHFYGIQALDKPADYVSPAIRMGGLLKKVLPEIRDNRPLFDSEHGPVKSYGKRRRNLPEVFDEYYFRYTQWAHMASGGAGGGMRWPYRHPHCLTGGMHKAQKSLAAFMQHVNWFCFNRKNLSNLIKVNNHQISLFACGTEQQVIIWLLNKVPTNTADQSAEKNSKGIQIRIPAIASRMYQILFWQTLEGKVTGIVDCTADVKGNLYLELKLLWPDVALLINLVPLS